jgi:hypothetical protein
MRLPNLALLSLDAKLREHKLRSQWGAPTDAEWDVTLSEEKWRKIEAVLNAAETALELLDKMTTNDLAIALDIHAVRRQLEEAIR